MLEPPQHQYHEEEAVWDMVGGTSFNEENIDKGQYNSYNPQGYGITSNDGSSRVYEPTTPSVPLPMSLGKSFVEEDCDRGMMATAAAMFSDAAHDAGSSFVPIKQSPSRYNPWHLALLHKENGMPRKKRVGCQGSCRSGRMRGHHCSCHFCWQCWK
eukprot:5325617-Ditylum_brightwellii.AAC.1